MRAMCGAVIGALLIAGRATAQSTDYLGSYQPGVQYQVSVGTRAPFITGYGRLMGPLRALDVSAQFPGPGVMTFRLDGWMIKRGPSPSDRQHNLSGDPLRSSLAVAAVVSGEFPIRLPYEISIGPIIGVGVLPYARGDFDHSTSSGGPAIVTRTGTGWVLSGGVAVRWRHLVIEEYIHEIEGADGPLGNGETAVLTIGWRF